MSKQKQILDEEPPQRTPLNEDVRTFHVKYPQCDMGGFIAILTGFRDYVDSRPDLSKEDNRCRIIKKHRVLCFETRLSQATLTDVLSKIEKNRLSSMSIRKEITAIDAEKRPAISDVRNIEDVEYLRQLYKSVFYQKMGLEQDIEAVIEDSQGEIEETRTERERLERERVEIKKTIEAHNATITTQGEKIAAITRECQRYKEEAKERERSIYSLERQKEDLEKRCLGDFSDENGALSFVSKVISARMNESQRVITLYNEIARDVQGRFGSFENFFEIYRKGFDQLEYNKAKENLEKFERAVQRMSQIASEEGIDASIIDSSKLNSLKVKIDELEKRNQDYTKIAEYVNSLNGSSIIIGVLQGKNSNYLVLPQQLNGEESEISKELERIIGSTESSFEKMRIGDIVCYRTAVEGARLIQDLEKRFEESTLGKLGVDFERLYLGVN